VLLSRSRGRIEMVIAVLLAVARVAVLASDTVGGYGIAQRIYLIRSSIWMLVTAVRLGCAAGTYSRHSLGKTHEVIVLGSPSAATPPRESAA
jgi:hypothetical protein